MMSEHEDFYTPEHIDEQVDTLLQARAMPDQDQRMADDLHMVLANADADAYSLQRVLHQLLEGENSTHRQNNESILSLEQMQQRKYKDQKVIRMQKIDHAKKTWPIMRVFSTIAATIVVAVLIGSVLILSHAAPQKNGSASTITGAAHNATATAASTSTVPQGIYASNASTMFRLDIQQKQQVIWQQAVPDVQQIVPAGNVVYILQSDTKSLNAVLELDANTGKILWKHSFSGQGSYEPTKLTFSQNQLYVSWIGIINNSYDDGYVDILNASNGDLLPFVYAHTLADNMDVNGGIFAVGNTGLQVYNATTHKLLWRAPMTESGKGFVSLKIVNNLIYVVFSSDNMDPNSGKSYIVVYEAATGKQVWQSPTFLGQALSNFAIDQNTIYFGSVNSSTQPFTGKIYAYNILSNKQLWSTPVDGGAQEALVFSNGMLYTTLNRWPQSAPLIAINAATGTIKWQQTSDTVVPSSFSLSNGILYIGHSNDISPSGSSLTAFNANSGQKLWEEIGKYGSGTQVATE
jgi:outer membrane protein assembly factor BamB